MFLIFNLINCAQNTKKSLQYSSANLQISIYDWSALQVFLKMEKSLVIELQMLLILEILIEIARNDKPEFKHAKVGFLV